MRNFISHKSYSAKSLYRLFLVGPTYHKSLFINPSSPPCFLLINFEEVRWPNEALRSWLLLPPYRCGLESTCGPWMPPHRPVNCLKRHFITATLAPFPGSFPAWEIESWDHWLLEGIIWRCDLLFWRWIRLYFPAVLSTRNAVHVSAAPWRQTSGLGVACCCGLREALRKRKGTFALCLGIGWQVQCRSRLLDDVSLPLWLSTAAENWHVGDWNWTGCSFRPS